MTAALARILEDLTARGSLVTGDIAEIAAVSPATVKRWAEGAAAPDPRIQMLLVKLHYVVERLSDLYAPGETRQWLFTPHPMLNGERAIDLIRSGRTEDVLAVIEKMEAGAFA